MAQCIHVGFPKLLVLVSNRVIMLDIELDNEVFYAQTIHCTFHIPSSELTCGPANLPSQEFFIPKVIVEMISIRV